MSPYRELVAQIREKHHMVVNNSTPQKTVQSLPRLATFVAPNDGEVFLYSGITITCKYNSSDTQGWRKVVISHWSLGRLMPDAHTGSIGN